MPHAQSTSADSRNLLLLCMPAAVPTRGGASLQQRVDGAPGCKDATLYWLALYHHGVCTHQLMRIRQQPRMSDGYCQHAAVHACVLQQ
jgi:hypothetical protein